MTKTANPQNVSSLRAEKRIVDDAVKFDNSDVLLDGVIDKHVNEFVFCNKEILEDTSW
jgi:hypothetical protein